MLLSNIEPGLNVGLALSAAQQVVRLGHILHALARIITSSLAACDSARRYADPGGACPAVVLRGRRRCFFLARYGGSADKVKKISVSLSPCLCARCVLCGNSSFVPAGGPVPYLLLEKLGRAEAWLRSRLLRGRSLYVLASA